MVHTGPYMYVYLVANIINLGPMIFIFTENRSVI